MTSIPKTPLDAVFESVESEFTKILEQPIRLSRIDQLTLTTWSEVWKPNSDRIPPNGGWSWIEKKQYNDKCHPEVRRFDVAVWSQDSLCGLSLGHLSKDSTHNAISYIEGCPLPHPLKGHILDIIHITAVEYAKLMRKKYVRLIEPVDNLIEQYKKLGFEYKIRGYSRKTPYCEKEV